MYIYFRFRLVYFTRAWKNSLFNCMKIDRVKLLMMDDELQRIYTPSIFKGEPHFHERQYIIVHADILEIAVYFFRKDVQIYSFHVLLEYPFTIYIFWCAKNEPLSWFSNFIHLTLKQRTPLGWMLTNGSIHVFWTYHSSQVLINEWLTFKVCSKLFHEISLLYIPAFIFPKLLRNISRYI